MARVLIVDDDKNVRRHLATYVQHLGHVSETAADAETALDLLKGEPFDIVLSDIRMERMNGLALLRELHREQPEVAVVLMTAHATVPQAVEAMRSGAYEYLMKPSSLDDIRLLINHIAETEALRWARRPVQRPRAEASAAARGLPDAAPARDAPDSLKDLERQRIEEVLAESLSFGEAARRLGIDSSTLWRKRRRYGIT
jgi:DNA-binding NtrC family response regulator